MSNEQHILNIFDKYINYKPINTSIMLSGEWGSGKTYFVKNILCPKLEKKYDKKCIYISLNGVSKTSDISKDIFIKTLPDKKKLPDWLKKIKSYGTEIGKVLLNKYAISSDLIDFSKLFNTNNFILVFDDLERCLIDIREILGYINRFVEHESVPTIIVANEQEIGTELHIKNQELKYFLTTLDSFEFPKEKSTIYNNKDNIKLTPKKIKERIQYLFGIENKYYNIKEKLIYKTLVYKPNISKLYKAILLNFSFNSNESEILLNNKNIIVNTFNSENHNNLRTLQFIFSHFLLICVELRHFKISELEERIILENILKYLVTFSVKYKSGAKLDYWTQPKEYAEVKFSEEVWDFSSILGFSFVNELVLDSYLDKEKFSYCIKIYLKEQIKSGLIHERSLKSLSNWYYMSDDEVEELINDIKEKINNNSYSFDFYATIISCFIVLEDIGFDIDIDNVCNNMKKNIKESDDVISVIDVFGLAIEDVHRERFYKYIEELNRDIKHNQVDVFNYKINEYLKVTKDWSKNFYDYVQSNKSNFIDKKTFFSLIRSSIFCESIINATNKDIINIRRAIKSVYNFSNIKTYYVKDKQSIISILGELEKKIENSNEDFGKVKMYHYKCLVEQLNDVVKRLQ